MSEGPTEPRRADQSTGEEVPGAVPEGRHYLDHASTSPIRPEAMAAVWAWMGGPGAADPARVHTEGRMARGAIEEARAHLAALLHARPRQVVFTSGATEAANAAVWGAVRARPGGAIVLAAVEHSCVRDASRRHAPVVQVAVDRLGRVDPDRFGDALAKAQADHGPVALAHCQWGNPEVGTLQPLEPIMARARSAGVPTHVDAAAAVGHVPVDLEALGADLVSVSSHKLGGPKGLGALVVGRGVRWDPFIVGGDQERGRRAGLENTPAIVGLGAVAELLATGTRLADEERRARAATARVLDRLAAMDGVVGYGDPSDRLPHIAALGVEGVEAEAVLLGLDQAGIAAHSGSACSSESLAPSPVLAAMGLDADRSLRVSVGWSTTDADIDAVLRALPEVVRQLRALRA